MVHVEHVLLVGSLAGLVVACPCQPRYPDPTTKKATESQTMEHAEIEKLARLELPRGVDDLQVKTESGGPDGAIWLRFTLPADEVDAFLANAGYTPENLSEKRRKLRKSAGGNLSWWDPESLDPFISGSYIREEGDRYGSNVIISRGAGPRETAYVFVTDL